MVDGEEGEGNGEWLMVDGEGREWGMVNDEWGGGLRFEI
jgi:hypothetical protein